MAKQIYKPRFKIDDEISSRLEDIFCSDINGSFDNTIEFVNDIRKNNISNTDDLNKHMSKITEYATNLVKLFQKSEDDDKCVQECIDVTVDHLCMQICSKAQENVDGGYVWMEYEDDWVDGMTYEDYIKRHN